ncbi:MAG: NADH-quinone oxidoreductase subunit N [Phycisphaerae bacterium]|nr:NADH-quinone oxidoreductase subunit N [Phycisphaerae bacterium]
MNLLIASVPIVEKLSYLGPEIVLFVATVVVMVLGLSPNHGVRRSCAGVSIVALVIAGVMSAWLPTPPHSLLPNLMPFAKMLVAAVGVLLVMALSGTVDREYESSLGRGGVFDGLRSTRGEFYAFILFSLTGLMLCASADDLIWLFLALELVSLPTYVMVSISTSGTRSQEAGIKYFFLGALGAAFFLYGFAMLYGATGTTMLFGDGVTPGIAEVLANNVATNGNIGGIALVGVVMSIVGVSFKIAAVPMHFYTADVYEGAASSVSAFLAFVPKAAGFISLMLLLSVVGWGYGGENSSLPEVLRVLLWVMAVMTMTVGNVLALLQTNVKRVLAYSSIAHSGYMLVGLIAGPGASGAPLSQNGLAATLFYLLCYGFMNLGTFAVLSCLERRPGEEIETFEDLRGLCRSYPILGWCMVICSLSLLGLPPLLGFAGKFYLFTSAISAGEIALVVIMGLNSAVAAFYYLRLAGAPLLEKSAGDEVSGCPYRSRGIAAALSAASVVALLPFAGRLMSASDKAATIRSPHAVAAVEPNAAK